MGAARRVGFSEPAAFHLIGASVGAILAHLTAHALPPSGGRALAVLLIDPPPPGPARAVLSPLTAHSELDAFKAMAVEAVRQGQQLARWRVDREVVTLRLEGCGGKYEAAHVAATSSPSLGRAQSITTACSGWSVG